MSGFSAEGLALREPVDSAARSESVAAFVAASLRGRSPLRIVDIGSGTGSNLRFLASRLAGRHRLLAFGDGPAHLSFELTHNNAG